MNRRKLGYALLALPILYAAVACSVFQIRHPWATENEQAVWIWSALKFERVPYSVMRPREGSQ